MILEKINWDKVNEIYNGLMESDNYNAIDAWYLAEDFYRAFCEKEDSLKLSAVKDGINCKIKNSDKEFKKNGFPNYQEYFIMGFRFAEKILQKKNYQITKRC